MIKYNVNSFITEEQAKEIIAMVNADYTQQQISAYTGIKLSNIKHVINRLI